MPAILKTVYNISPSVDLSNHDDITLIQLLHSEFGPTVTKDSIDTMESMVQSGVTSWETSFTTINTGARTFTHERQFSTAEAAESRKTWSQANLPATTTSFTLVGASVTDLSELFEYGGRVI